MTCKILHRFYRNYLLDFTWTRYHLTIRKFLREDYGQMDFFGLLTMVGGLALFLYGMKTMGDALSKMAGGRLEQVLERMTDNPVKAVLLGAGVTAVIQSSSATTVMVVGFVNSGIMKLSQAVGVIMGANIGTTVTSWVLSLSIRQTAQSLR